jgi:hypothetical protein
MKDEVAFELVERELEGVERKNDLDKDIRGV